MHNCCDGSGNTRRVSKIPDTHLPVLQKKTRQYPKNPYRLKSLYHKIVCILLRNAHKMTRQAELTVCTESEPVCVHFTKVNKLPYDTTTLADRSGTKNTRYLTARTKKEIPARYPKMNIRTRPMPEKSTYTRPITTQLCT